MELRRADLGKHPLWYSNQGWRARIGIVYPGAGFHHIGDFHKLAPKGVAVGAAAVPRHKDESAEAMMHLDEKVVECELVFQHLAGHLFRMLLIFRNGNHPVFNHGDAAAAITAHQPREVSNNPLIVSAHGKVDGNRSARGVNGRKKTNIAGTRLRPTPLTAPFDKDLQTSISHLCDSSSHLRESNSMTK